MPVTNKYRQALEGYGFPLLCLAMTALSLPFIFAARNREAILGQIAKEMRTVSSVPTAGQTYVSASLLPPDAYFLFIEALNRGRNLDVLQEPMAEYLKGVSFPSASERAAITEMEQLLTQATQASPFDEALWMDEAWLAKILGDRERAVTLCETAVRYANNDHIVLASAGMLFESARRDDDAIKVYATALSSNPRFVDSRFFLDLRARWPAASQQILENTISTLRRDFNRSSSPIAAAKLAKLLLYAGELESGRKLLEEALRELPNLEGAWLNLGEYYEKTGSTNSAINCYRKATYLDSIDPIPFYRLGKLLLANGRSQEGLALLLSAATNYGFMHTEHSDRVWLMYHPPIRALNDSLPVHLLSYLAALPDRAQIYAEIAAEYRRIGLANLADWYDQCSRYAN